MELLSFHSKTFLFNEIIMLFFFCTTNLKINIFLHNLYKLHNLQSDLFLQNASIFEVRLIQSCLTRFQKVLRQIKIKINIIYKRILCPIFNTLQLNIHCTQLSKFHIPDNLCERNKLFFRYKKNNLLSNR